MRIEVLEQPFEGFFMDKVYRVFQKGEDSKTGKVVTDIESRNYQLQTVRRATIVHRNGSLAYA